MSININSIMSRVDEYAQSDVGRKRMNDYIQKKFSAGENKTDSGTEIIPEERIYLAAAKFIQVLQSTVASYDLPESVMQHISSMESGSILVSKDGCELPLYLGGDMHRDSLENDYHEYGGIENIVALFNNGYHASNYVYGWWNNHTPSGGAIGKSLYNDGFAWVKSKKDREALHFMQQAVDDFNGNYGSEYDVYVSLNSIYQI
jgi:hypothetical protein